MTKNRFAPARFSAGFLTLNGFLLISLILASCSGIPGISTATPVVPTPTFLQQAAPPAIVETDPPLGSVIGHLSPITFYFNQPMNQATVEPAFNGLPRGGYLWRDESTLLYTPADPYTPNSQLKISIAASVQSASGFGPAEPIELAFAVADFLRATNVLPKADVTDANVDAAIAASFNQPVVALGADPAAHTPAFDIQPAVSGRGEWINTSTYIFYPNPPMAGATEYTVSLNPALKTVSGVGLALSETEGLDGGGQNAWKFVTARPRVVELSPTNKDPMYLDAGITLTFNQPMDTESVQSNFLLSGNDGPVSGTFTWNEAATELTFQPDGLLARNVGYRVNLNAEAKSRGGTALGEEYGAVLNTMSDFAVARTETTNYGLTTLFFSAPFPDGNYESLVTITPAVDNLNVEVYQGEWALQLFGGFIPETDYAIEVARSFADLWGQSLGEPFVLNVRTPPIPPRLNLQFYGSNTLFVLPDEPMLYANAVNIEAVKATTAPVSLEEFFALQSGQVNLPSYAPANPEIVEQAFDLPPSREREVALNLTRSENPLPTGLYYTALTSPQLRAEEKRIYFAAVSRVNLTFKLGGTEALVWAVDLSTGEPVADTPVTIHDYEGRIIASGSTDEDGLWRGPITRQAGGPLQFPQFQSYAVLGAPGEDTFALAISNWSTGVGFAQIAEPHIELYVYTDRPIYQPGDTVYFRGVARQAFNGRYELPAINSVPVSIIDWGGTPILSLDLPLSPFGTFNGEFTLANDAAPGYYSIRNEPYNFYLGFQVAEYRKPEFDLHVNFPTEEVQLGDPSAAAVNAQYFFGAPAGGVEVRWSLYAQPDTFHLPGYQTGLLDDSWLRGDSRFGDFFGEGTAQTNPEGIASIELPAIPEREELQTITLEVTAVDESGLPVSARANMRVHPADFYIGLQPDDWVGTAKSAIGFDVITADWAGAASGDKTLAAEFKQVRWEKTTGEFGVSTYTPVYTPVGSSDFVTGPDGRARLSFVPPSAGTFMLDVSGGGARTQVLIWVGGAGTATWPDLPDRNLKLTADKDSYIAGDTAVVFIPNPFAENSQTLVTLERGVLFNTEVITLTGSGREYTLPLDDDDAPNVYLAVTVLGQGSEFRQGRVNIPVAPDAQELNVQVTSDPAQAGPRENVNLLVAVTDHRGQPVEGEFSLAFVDKAVLALADPNSPDILPAFYGNQPPGIQTGISLAAYSGDFVGGVGGGGGGGDGSPPFVREEFPDTAYWNPSLITNSEGRGQVTVTLPDSLTTWQIDVRGLTLDTKVGQAETQIVSTKPLLLRPVTPRFLVKDDHVLVAAIVNNNTSGRLNVDVSLQSEGFVLDDPGTAAQQVAVPANGRTRVEWWGTASPAEFADLIFTATAKGNLSLQDSTRPVWGKLPIVQYTSPQAFVTGGALRGAATQQEVISLPRTFTPSSGGLEVELSPSQAGNLIPALEAMQTPNENSAEAVVSYLLPHIEVHRALSNAGLNDPQLAQRVEANLNPSVSRLFYLQNADGGWDWWGRSLSTSATGEGGSEASDFIRSFSRHYRESGGGGGGSDPLISAYVFFGLMRAREAGAPMNEEAIQRAGSFLRSRIPAINNDTSGAALEEATFLLYALSQANTFDETAINRLYEARDRMNPTSLAWLALTIREFNEADPRARAIVSSLEAAAIRTSSSSHWETSGGDIFDPRSTIYTTSIVVYALSQLDAANSTLFNAVRYLAAHRGGNGMWNLGHDNAWAILALNAAMTGMGDLRADYSFSAALNGGPLASGDIAGIQIRPTTAVIPLEFLSPNSPNLLVITREDGLGRLYYNATLQLNRRVEEVKPLDQGMQISRSYIDSDCENNCPPLSSFNLDPDKLITAQLTLTLPNDAYYVMVEDFIPAGTEILDQNLKTSQQAIDSTEVQVQYDDEDPFAEGWGWWLFNEPQIRGDGILFTADFLPAGTYVLTYTLTPLQAGEFRVLPAHTWQALFPDVQGTSGGTVVEVKP